MRPSIKSSEFSGSLSLSLSLSPSLTLFYFLQGIERERDEHKPITSCIQRLSSPRAFGRALQLQVFRPFSLLQLPSGHSLQDFMGRSVSKQEEREITLDEISKYFDVPLGMAAKQLNMCKTRLKRKCRQLGIQRWPHRKVKSLETMIRNMNDLAKGEWEIEEWELQQAIERLERKKHEIKTTPETPLEEETKKLRQDCSKALFKRKKLQTRMLPPRPRRSFGGEGSSGKSIKNT